MIKRKNLNILIAMFLIALVGIISIYFLLDNEDRKILVKNTIDKNTTNLIDKCFDSDGGNNYYLKGYVQQYSGEIYWDQCRKEEYLVKSDVEECSDDGCFLYEMLCNQNVYGPVIDLKKINSLNNYFYIAKIQCLDGCNDGVCKTNRELKKACTSFPCYFDGNVKVNHWGTYDSPPDRISAYYPYEFELIEETPVKLTIRYSVWASEPQNSNNTMFIELDDKVVFRDSQDWIKEEDIPIEIDLGVLGPKKHFIKIYALDNGRFMFDWFKIDKK